MQKVTQKIFDCKNSFRLSPSLKQLAVEAVFYLSRWLILNMVITYIRRREALNKKFLIWLGAVERRRRRSRIEFFQPEFLVTFLFAIAHETAIAKFDKKVT